ncbi:hypothetical protein EDD11_010382 [Mortierella claussenii]|nr:hypothetical protein EDD11_010382 [Mortierella claussenii]
MKNTLPQPKTEIQVLGRLVRDLIKRCRSGDDLLDCFIPILLEPGMLVPKSKKNRCTVRDLTLDNLGRMVDLCWMPLMTKLAQELTAFSSAKDGEPLSFWVRLLEAMLDKLIEANDAAQAAALPTATVEQKSVAKTGSYLITILAWMKHLIKLHYGQVRSSRTRTASSSSSSLSLSSISPSTTTTTTAATTTTTTTATSATTPPPRLSIAAMAAQLVAGNAAANQPPVMFENDDMINLVEDCLQNILVHVSPLIRSVLNTVIECDPEVKDKIGPILKQIDQRIVSGGNSASFSAASSPSIPPVALSPVIVAAVPATWPSTSADQEQQQQQHQQQQHQQVENDTEMEGSGSSHIMDTDTSQTPASQNQQPPVIMSEPQEPADAWTLYGEDEWRPCPMGCLPGGIIPDLSLPWDLDSPPVARIVI